MRKLNIDLSQFGSTSVVIDGVTHNLVDSNIQIIVGEDK